MTNRKIAEVLASDDMANGVITEDQYSDHVERIIRWLETQRDAHVRQMHADNDY